MTQAAYYRGKSLSLRGVKQSAQAATWGQFPHGQTQCKQLAPRFRDVSVPLSSLAPKHLRGTAHEGRKRRSWIYGWRQQGFKARADLSAWHVMNTCQAGKQRRRRRAFCPLFSPAKATGFPSWDSSLATYPSQALPNGPLPHTRIGSSRHSHPSPTSTDP